MELEEYQLVMLRRPPNAREYDDVTIEQIQREHLAYGASLRAAGHTAANGPVLDQPDESLRGLSFYCVGSVEEARRLAERDPAVKAGRLVVEVMNWWCPAGSLVRSGRRFTLDEA